MERLTLFVLLFLVSCGKPITEKKPKNGPTFSDLEERVYVLETALSQRTEELVVAKSELEALILANDTELDVIKQLVSVLENTIAGLEREIEKLKKEKKK